MSLPNRPEVRVMSRPEASLEPLAEHHRQPLAAAAAAPEIWTLLPFNIAAGFDAFFDFMLEEQAAGRWSPFIVRNSVGAVVGQTCYLDFRDADRGVEIGGTWYEPSAQGTAINPAAKLLMLENAFASGIVRVQFKTDIRNARSRAALAKLGATFEGVFRKHIQRPDRTWRDSVFYSITDDDWPRIQARLVQRLSGMGALA